MTPKKILVHAPNWIGDQVLSFPFFYHLRKKFPEAYIGVVARPWVAKLQFKNLVNEVFVNEHFLRAINPALISQGPWDLGFALPNSFSSAWVLRKSGVQIRVGFDGELRTLLLQKAYSRKGLYGVHRAQQYVSLLREYSTDGMGPHSMVRSSLEFFDPKVSWSNSGDLPTPSNGYWVLAPGSAAESRRWSADSFQILARRIHEKTGMQGLILGGESERILAQELAADPKNGLKNHCAEFGLAELWKFFQGSRFTLANDSGLAHVAAISGARTHIIWGAGNDQHTLPFGPGRVSISQHRLPCWPCEKNKCPKFGGAHLACLSELSVDAVFLDLQRHKLI